MARPKIKAAPLSIRLTQATDHFVAVEARRRKRSKSAIVEELTEEAARMRRFPGIGFRGEEERRRAWVIGTGLDVWEVIELYDAHGGDMKKLLADHQSLSERAVTLALAYSERYRGEIDEKIADNRRPVEEWRELAPFIE
jgi:uncharacterized protein (DUF433 family)